MEYKPGFYAIITAAVRYDSRLTPNSKLLYAELTALCNSKGFCWAENEYFANLYGVSNRSISRWLTDLNECGYIRVVTDITNKRKIFVTEPTTKLSTPTTKLSTPHDKIVQGTIYSINNTINTPGSALEFVINNFAIRFEQEFLMPMEKEFKDQNQFDEFLKDFNDEAEQKEKDFSSWLIPMLKKYSRKWVNYQSKNKSFDKNNDQSDKQTNPNFGAAI
ncbi:replication initiation protein [Cellulophaga phage phi39:1]|uniref:replication initiation protein n=1 Tax=Cellulophaga phage phi39:1 TaxID=1327993 RepID=UPI000351C709|nr:replication initiation protein [Cellulophaga phage phi39:1]AGO49156.1 helix-turn-helix domain containing protein [Cellulophaga phage phi39:1]